MALHASLRELELRAAVGARANERLAAATVRRLERHLDLVGRRAAHRDLLTRGDAAAHAGRLITEQLLTGGGQSGAELPRAQGHVFQLVAEEVRAVPETAAGMFLS